MYNVKFVGESPDDATEIVPAGRLSYEIELVESYEEYRKVLAEWNSYWQPYAGPDQTTIFPEWGVRVAVIQLYEDPYESWAGAHETVILVSGYAYIMNDTGKTIDKIL